MAGGASLLVSLPASSAIDAVTYNVTYTALESARTGQNQFGLKTVSDIGTTFAVDFATGGIAGGIANKFASKFSSSIEKSATKNIMNKAYSTIMKKERPEVYDFASKFGMNVNEKMRRSLFKTTATGIDELSNRFAKNFINPSIFAGNVVSKAPQWTEISWGLENKLCNKTKNIFK